jgi:hypothetical protein
LVQPPLVVAARSLSRELFASHTRGQLILGIDRHLVMRINGHSPVSSIAEA